jgi:hypothetical protein
MNPEALIRQLVQAVTEVIQSGEELSDELQGLIADTLANLMSRLGQGQGGEGMPIKPPELNNAQHPSAQVNAFKYDQNSQELFIKYQDKYPGQNGPVYKYSGVPKFIYDVFSRGGVPPKTSGKNEWHEWKEGITPSLGAAVNALIKAGGFQYQKIG